MDNRELGGADRGCTFRSKKASCEARQITRGNLTRRGIALFRACSSRNPGAQYKLEYINVQHNAI
jgi:hypothetical protein